MSAFVSGHLLQAIVLTARVTGSVGRSRLATHSGETEGGISLVADLAEERRTGEVGDVVGDLEVAVGTCTLGMDLHNASVTV